MTCKTFNTWWAPDIQSLLLLLLLDSGVCTVPGFTYSTIAWLSRMQGILTSWAQSQWVINAQNNKSHQQTNLPWLITASQAFAFVFVSGIKQVLTTKKPSHVERVNFISIKVSVRTQDCGRGCMKPPLLNEKLQVTPLSVTAAYVTNWAHFPRLVLLPILSGDGGWEWALCPWGHTKCWDKDGKVWSLWSRRWNMRVRRRCKSLVRYIL